MHVMAVDILAALPIPPLRSLYLAGIPTAVNINPQVALNLHPILITDTVTPHSE